MKKILSALAAILFLPTTVQAGCGANPEPCETEGGTYHIKVPRGPSAGAVIFLHGWGSSGEGSLRMTGMVETMMSRGYIVIAPDGTPREGRNGRSWSFHPNMPARRDEVAFLQNVKNDASARFGFDPEKVLLSGFSIGGSMAAYVACAAPDAFAGYAPVGGGMWRPYPEDCKGPVRMLHTHGWRDGTVPLEGRVLRGGSFENPDALIQGDAFATMEIWRRTNKCTNHKPDSFAVTDPWWRRAWTSCAEGSHLEFVLHAGGHSMPPGWTTLALDWFEAPAKTE